MRSVVFAIVLALIPGVVSAAPKCDAFEKFMSKWELDASALLLVTKDVTTHQPVYVFDLGHKQPSPQGRYAITWIDETSCTTEAVFRDLPGMLTTMEQQVYDIY
jgi:hypothetical protein